MNVLARKSNKRTHSTLNDTLEYFLSWKYPWLSRNLEKSKLTPMEPRVTSNAEFFFLHKFHSLLWYKVKKKTLGKE